MIHSKISPYIELKNSIISIREAANKTILFFRELAKTEPKFKIIKVVSLNKPLNESIDITLSNSVEVLAEEILHQNLKKLQRKNKLENISIDYSDAEILHYSLTSEYEENESILTLFFSFTTSKWLNSKIGSIVSHQNYFCNQSKCIDFIKAAIKVFNPNYVIIRPTNDRGFTKALMKYKHNSKIGNFTYFKHDLEYNFPKKIKNGSIEKMPNGDLYKLKSFDDLEIVKNEIISFMEDFEKLESRILKE